LEKLGQTVETLTSRVKVLEEFRVKDSEHSEVVTELLEMVAEDVSRLKKRNREYELAFELASSEIDEIKEKMVGHEHSGQPIVAPDEGCISEEHEERDALVESLTEKAVVACEQEQPEIIPPEVLGGGVPSGARSIFARDWDVAMIIREYQRRAGNVHSN